MLKQNQKPKIGNVRYSTLIQYPSLGIILSKFPDEPNLPPKLMMMASGEDLMI